MMKRHGKIILTAGLLLAVLFVLQGLVVPKYMGDTIEGAMIAEYYDEGKNHDVIIIGDCEVYENISPAVLWRDYGINAYIRGSAQQTMWQSYYLLRETLRYETPKVVILSVFAMQYDTPQNEAYNRMTLDGMRWSPDKVDAIRTSMTEDEHFVEYVFPILRFHDRWKELSADDLRYYTHRDPVTHNGYYLRTEVRPAGALPMPQPQADYSFGDNATAFLDRIVQLCEEKDITLILIKAPSLWPHWFDEWDEQIVSYAASHDLPYLNLLADADRIGLDFSKDTYDGGLHLNVYGAEKVAAYLGEYLQKEAELPDRRRDPILSAVWNKKLEDYDREKDAGTETAP